MNREQRLADTFVELADTLVNDFDVVQLLDLLVARCAELLDVTAAALFLAPPGTGLRPMAMSDSEAGLSDLLAIAQHEGPAWESHQEVVSVGPVDLDSVCRRWPGFGAAAENAGYHQACSVPMRLREDVLGALLLLHAEPGVMTAADTRLVQALADAATIGILHERAIRRQTDLSSQLHTALRSRILIEQAKGILAARRNTSVETAFELMRGHARRNRRRIGEVARHVVETSGALPVFQES